MRFLTPLLPSLLPSPQTLSSVTSVTARTSLRDAARTASSGHRAARTAIGDIA
ncbi:MAG: hypothetical protein HWQ38_26075 [Nostoc sp. NMS7]|uniref:hypothetical protein n=1 Tax=Nostoc sp. NMS7 TaxID=2815391 RepID=UPI0025D24B1D|nr:hypothetical protein [Nostoc sp. NMS7]MBN3949744.1 hypothetical protein [Nostoc sp. NMS7]